jgi:probable rRNA maturation factor
MASINFFTEDVKFKVRNPRSVKTWIKRAIDQEGKTLKQLNYIFCSDKHLLTINRDYLNHHSLTDIITFDNSENNGWIEGDVFISVDRVLENSIGYNVEFDEELHRVMIHGALHLVGYADKSKPQKAQMRKKEDAYLSLRKF